MFRLRGAIGRKAKKMLKCTFSSCFQDVLKFVGFIKVLLKRSLHFIVDEMRGQSLQQFLQHSLKKKPEAPFHDTERNKRERERTKD